MTYTIIIADDEPMVREVLAMYVRKIYETAGSDSLEIVEAGNGSELLEQARKISPDLIITDDRMPRLSGRETIREIREYDPDTPIYLISGSSTESEAREAGATGFFPKPFTGQDLEDKLRPHFEERQVGS